MKENCEETKRVTNPPILVNTHLEVIQEAEFGVRHAFPAAGSRFASLPFHACIASLTTFAAAWFLDPIRGILGAFLLLYPW